MTKRKKSAPPKDGACEDSLANKHDQRLLDQDNNGQSSDVKEVATMANHNPQLKLLVSSSSSTSNKNGPHLPKHDEHNNIARIGLALSSGGRNKKGKLDPEATPVDEWTCDQVHEWLRSNGFAKYARLIAYEHEVDGPTLLLLGEADFRQKPLEISSLGDVKRLGKALTSLRLRCVSRYGSRTPSVADPDDSDSMARHYPNFSMHNGLLNRSAIHKAHLGQGLLKSRSDDVLAVRKQKLESREDEDDGMEFEFPTREELIAKVESPDTKSKSLFKLIIAFFYCMLSLLMTSFVMVLVHDRTPDMTKYPPLPDIVLDNLPLIPWAFEVCEMLAMCMSVVWVLVLFFHKHRVIVMRRMFSLVGTVFLLRCVTMLITSLSVPGVHLDCEAKRHGSVWEQFKEAYSIWTNMGLSIKGVRSCGDYMFSGHTTAITMLNHFITEYTPDSWHWLQTSTWVMNLFGIFFILAGHEHYSIDVLVAFYISSRLFLYYHVYAYNHALVTQTDSRTRMWFPLGWFFEAGGHGRVPNEYAFPIPVPKLDLIKRRLKAALSYVFAKKEETLPPNTKTPNNNHSLKRKASNSAGGSKKQR